MNVAISSCHCRNFGHAPYRAHCHNILFDFSDWGIRFSMLSCRTVAISFILSCSDLLICMNEYLTIDSGRYLYTSSLCALIAAWLNSSFSFTFACGKSMRLCGSSCIV